MNSDLDKLLLNISKYSSCTHHKPGTESTCKKNCTAIRKIVFDNNDMSVVVVNQFINYILGLNVYCHIANSNTVQELISKICSKVNIDQPQYIDSLYKIMASSYVNLDTIFQIMIKNKDFKFFSQEFVSKYVELRKYINVHHILDYINIETSPQIIYSLAAYKNEDISKKLSCLVDKCNINLDNDLLEKIVQLSIQNMPHSRPLLLSLHNRNKYTAEYMITCYNSTIIEYKSPEILKLIFNLTKSVPNKSNFNRILNTSTSISTSSTSRFQENLEVLLENGYVLDRDDIISSINKKHEILGLERCNIKLDRVIYNLCIEKLFFPTYYFDFDGYNQTMYNLYKMCATYDSRSYNPIRSSKKIATYIENNGLIPDDTCMRIGIENNLGDLVNTLIEHGYKPNYEILLCFMNHNKTPGNFKNMLDIYNLEMIKKYSAIEAKYKNLEVKYNDLEIKYKTLNKEEVNEKVIKEVKEIKEQENLKEEFKDLIEEFLD